MFADVLAPACISVDHPRFLSFVPAAPTEASILFDLVVGASSIYGGSWLEGGGAVFAENEALRWIADLAGLPADRRRRVRQRRDGRQPERAARRPLALARARRRRPRPHPRPDPGVGRRALVGRPGGAGDGRRRRRRAGRRRGPADRGRAAGDASAALDADDRDRLFAIVATSGTTNAGVVDDLAAAAAACARARHVAARRRRLRRRRPSPRRACATAFAGVEAADSFIVDPHKWLFAPFDSCALLYRDPDDRPPRPHPARRVPRRAPRRPDDGPRVERVRLRPPPVAPGPRPAALVQPRDPRHRRLRRGDRDDAARRPRGRRARRAPRRTSSCSLEPELSIVLFRRLGWDAATYQAWSDDQLARRGSRSSRRRRGTARPCCGGASSTR